MDLKRLHHRVRRLCALGLLRKVEERKRAGRAIKLYQAVSERFFIPFEAAPELFTEGLAREMRASVRDEHLRRGDGALLSLGAGNVPQLRFVADESPAEPGPELWLLLRLERREVTKLRRELKELFDRHAANASGRGKVYLVHAAVAERLSETVSVDNVRSR